MDLHRLSADFSEHQVQVLEVLVAGKSQGTAQVEVITDAGRHGGKGGPIIKNQIVGLSGRPPRRLNGATFGTWH